MTIKDLDFYCKKFAKLRVSTNKKRGVAPHKPILLLAIIELFDRGLITQNKIYITAELITTFRKYWKYLKTESHHPEIYEPFYHLKGDQFWHLRTKTGLEAMLSGFKPKSLNALKKLVLFAYVDDELFILFRDPFSRKSLIHSIVEAWFSHKIEQVEKLLKIDAFADWQTEQKAIGGKIYKEEELKDEEDNIIRDAGFRRLILSLYDHRCVVCQLQVIALSGQGIVDGAHIRPFSEFRDDRIINGLSLCKNHHWAFDRGWFGINGNYQIKVIDDLHEDELSPPFLRHLHGSKILLPHNEKDYPSRDALQWHYENTYQV